MSTFIKPGFWIEKKKGFKEWLNLDQFVDKKIAAIPSGGGDSEITSSLIIDGTTLVSEGKTLVVPEGIITVGDNAFNENTFTSVTMASTVTTIGDSAFYYTPITEIILNEGLESIGAESFFENSFIEIILPSTLKTIGDSAFEYCAIEAIDFPEGVTLIGPEAFKNNSNLTTATFGTGLATGSIGLNAFQNCGLTAVSIPTGCTVDANAFDVGVIITYY